MDFVRSRGERGEESKRRDAGGGDENEMVRVVPVVGR